MSALTALRRGADLRRLADRREPLDVLVIGGGITGVGAALDAATRGLQVALVDAGDLASGTSRWSSKLVHGGLRYLATGQLGIARESAVERHHLMTTIAPHLIRPLRQVIPDAGPRRSTALMRAGAPPPTDHVSAETYRTDNSGPPARLQASSATPMTASTAPVST